MKIRKSLCLFIIMGMVYLDLEIVSRVIKMDLVGWGGLKEVSLAGWTSLWMLPIGGLCGVLIGLLNEKKKTHMALMSLISMLLIFSIELTSGFVLNILFHLNIWDYRDLPANLMGQVSLVYLIPWFFIAPFAMWLDDILRFYMYAEERPSMLVEYYKNIFRKSQL